MSERDREHGVVVNWDIGGRDYGFIHPDQHNELRDVFYSCHRDLAAGVHNLTAGERVTFLMERGERGLRASDVQLESETLREIEAPVDRTEKRNTRYDGN
jgi:cold shock CspA family protein